ncbi:MAG: putative membrane protein YedE/YeeE [Polyangiales bacterium]|jgi:uncharacterized membrane protein YedE/YeeE
MTTPRFEKSFAFVSGVVFAAGLALAGMTQPSKVIGFFDFSRGLDSWDPSLAFVMLGGIVVFTPVFHLISKRDRPWLSSTFRLPTRTDIDRPLIIGAALFGLGWGIAGYCPGPALASAGSGSMSALILVGSMFTGMKLYQLFAART